MEEKIVEVITTYAPLVATVVATVISSIAIIRNAIKKLKLEIKTIEPSEKDKDITNRLARIENEILEMRGKRK